MTVALMVSLLASAPAVPAAPAAARSDDPPVEVSLNQDGYFERGDRARVHVRVRDDGYLVVLRADADGRVRVLFPLDPGDDAFVRGGRKIEVRGRGDREAFSVDEREGSGVVLAAHSTTPFRFDEFVRGDHWDYRVLAASLGGNDKEAVLLDMVQRMVADGTFEYDVVTYTVEPPGGRYGRYHTHYSSIGLQVGFGYGWPRDRFWFARGSCYDPFFYDPWYCGRTFYDPFFHDAFFYDPFFYGGYGYYRPYRPFIYGGGIVIYNRPRYRSRLFIDRIGPSVGGAVPFRDRARAPIAMGVGPRYRIPQGTLLNGTTRVRSVAVSAPARSEPVRERDIWSDRARSTPARAAAPERAPAPAAAPARERPSAPERRPAVDRGSDRRDGSRGAATPAQGSRGADRPAPARSADRGDRGASRGSGSSRGGGGWSGGGGGGGGGGGRSSAGRGSSSGSSGSGRGSAPANGGGRRRS